MNIGNSLKTAKNVVTSKAGRQILKGQKHSPAILFGAGVVGFGATVVLSCKASLKLEDILEENEEKSRQAQDMLASNDERYSASDYNKDAAKLKVRLITDVGRLYAPSAVVGVLTICAFGGSHVILTRRNAGLVAAYTVLDKSFREYRERVTEFVGTEKERELRFGAETREIAVDTENGTEVHNIRSASGLSQYARVWDRDTSTSWSPQADYNLVTLRAHQAYMNDVLQRKGHVLLNDVFDALGLERTKAGCVVGWVKEHGDNYIDFGLFNDRNKLEFMDFMTGREGGLVLDFNVDGLIYNLI